MGLLRRGQAAGTPSATAASYDAFISYAHDDLRLARALQSGLHRFAKPWYRLRALRVFRDEASLAADPALRVALTRALDGAEWFLLLASPSAAASEWVALEVEYWCRHRPVERLLIVLADGAIEWDEEAGGFDWNRTDALPASLRGALDHEPRFVDLTWGRDIADLSLRNPVFAAAVADIAAPLHDRPKDELLGEDVRQHRRVRRMTGVAILTLSVLLVAAVVAALVALEQRETAQNERDRATQQERIAVSRQLAAEATAARDEELDLALLLAAQAYAIQPTSQARGALLAVLARSPHLEGFLPGTAGTTALALDPTDSRLLVGTEDGGVSVWDLETMLPGRGIEPVGGRPVTAVAFGSDGRVAAAGSARGAVVVWDTRTGLRVGETAVGSHVHALAFDDGGDLLAVADDEGLVTVWEPGSGEQQHRLRGERVTPANTVVFRADGMLLTGDGQGFVETWRLQPEPLLVRSLRAGGGQPLVSEFSADAAQFAAVTLGQGTPYLFDVATGSFRFDTNLEGPTTSVDDMAFSPDGRTLATVGEGRVTLWDLGLGAARAQLPGAPVTSWRTRTADVRRGLIDVGVGGRVVAVAGEQGVAVWDLDSHTLRRTIQVTGTTALENVPNVFRGAASAVFSQDGGMLAWTVLRRSGLAVVVWNLDDDRLVLRVPGERVLGFDPDGTTLATRGFLEDRVMLVDLGTGHRREVDNVPWALAPVGESTNTPWTVHSRGVGASIEFDGTVTFWDVERGQPVGAVDVPGASDFAALVFDPEGRRLAVASAGGALTVIDTDVASWQWKACALAARSLTEEELISFIGDANPDDACSTIRNNGIERG